MFDQDPSLEPLINMRYPTEPGAKKYSERWRAVCDLDGDGTNDLILSEDEREFGNAGGRWTVYLNRNNKYCQVGEGGQIFAHPGAISIEPDHGRFFKKADYFARVWVYCHGGGNEGLLGYYRIKEKSIDDFVNLTIYPGDGGSELGNQVYDAVFGKSPIKCSIERSSTEDDGKVHWISDEIYNR
jgi:hypothetical protein